MEINLEFLITLHSIFSAKFFMKNTYETPVVEIIEMNLEQSILVTSDPNGPFLEPGEDL